MGFLHEGQLSLVRAAAAQNGCVVVSCFVNPTSFSSPQELASSPSDEARDPDGLAIAAANRALSIEERHAATCLFAALESVRKAYDRGERSAEVLRARMTDVIAGEPMARPDYISVADAYTLDELQRIT